MENKIRCRIWQKNAQKVRKKKYKKTAKNRRENPLWKTLLYPITSIVFVYVRTQKMSFSILFVRKLFHCERTKIYSQPVFFLYKYFDSTPSSSTLSWHSLILYCVFFYCLCHSLCGAFAYKWFHDTVVIFFLFLAYIYVKYICMKVTNIHLCDK